MRNNFPCRDNHSRQMMAVTANCHSPEGTSWIR